MAVNSKLRDAIEASRNKLDEGVNNAYNNPGYNRPEEDEDRESQGPGRIVGGGVKKPKPQQTVGVQQPAPESQLENIIDNTPGPDPYAGPSTEEREAVWNKRHGTTNAESPGYSETPYYPDLTPDIPNTTPEVPTTPQPETPQEQEQSYTQPETPTPSRTYRSGEVDDQFGPRYLLNDEQTSNQDILNDLVNNQNDQNNQDTEWTPTADNGGSALGGTNYPGNGFVPTPTLRFDPVNNLTDEQVMDEWLKRMNGVTTTPNERVLAEVAPNAQETADRVNSDMRRPGSDYEPSSEMAGSRYEGSVTPLEARQYYEDFLENLLENPENTDLLQKRREAINNYVEPQTPNPSADTGLPNPQQVPGPTGAQNPSLSYDWQVNSPDSDYVFDTENPYFNGENSIVKTVETLKDRADLVKEGYNEAKKQQGWTERDRRAYADYYADQKTQELSTQKQIQKDIEEANRAANEARNGQGNRPDNTSQNPVSSEPVLPPYSNGESSRPGVNDLEAIIDQPTSAGTTGTSGNTGTPSTTGGFSFANNIENLIDRSGTTGGTTGGTTKPSTSGTLGKPGTKGKVDVTGTGGKTTDGNAVPEGSQYFRPSYGQQEGPVVKAPYKTGGYTEAEIQAMGNKPYTTYRGTVGYEGYYQAPDKRWYPVDMSRVNQRNYYGGNYSYSGGGSGGGSNRMPYIKRTSDGRTYFSGNEYMNGTGGSGGSSKSGGSSGRIYSNGSAYYPSGNNTNTYVQPDLVDQTRYRVSNFMKNWAAS